MTQNETSLISKDDVVVLVYKVISDILYVQEDRTALTLDSRFEEDLSADRRSIEEVFESLEEEFVSRMVGFSFDEKDISEIETIGDLVTIIYKQVFPKEYDLEVNNG